MKTTILFVISALALLGADNKPPAEPKQIALSEAQLTHMQKAISDAKRLDLEFKIAEYRKEIDAVQKEYQTAMEQACTSLGVPKDKIASECKPDLEWADPATKTADNPTGKIVGRVVWLTVAPAPASITGKPKDEKDPR